MTLSQLLAQYLMSAVKNWKSTVQGFLSLLVCVGLYLVASPSSVLSTHTVALITLYTGVAKQVLALSQKD
jgi:uncharacterized membrane protein HdeD (DUF308 family)